MVDGYRAGYASRARRDEWVDVFIQESLRDQLRAMASRNARLVASVIDYLKALGKENALEYLTRLRREVERQK